MRAAWSETVMRAAWSETVMSEKRGQRWSCVKSVVRDGHA